MFRCLEYKYEPAIGSFLLCTRYHHWSFKKTHEYNRNLLLHSGASKYHKVKMVNGFHYSTADIVINVSITMKKYKNMWEHLYFNWVINIRISINFVRLRLSQSKVNWYNQKLSAVWAEQLPVFIKLIISINEFYCIQETSNLR